MSIRVHIFTVLVAFSGFVSEAYPAEIIWSLYLKPFMNEGPVRSLSLQEGQEFTIRDVHLTGGQTRCRELLDELEGTTFLIQQSPVNQTLEIRIILNVQASIFDNAGGVLTFLNISFGAFVNGRMEDNLQFSTGSPMVMTIRSGTGLDNLLEKGDSSRSDNIKFVYYNGGRFDADGIKTYNSSSGLSAEISRISTVVGGVGEDLGFPSNSKYNTWGKIKMLFQ